MPAGESASSRSESEKGKPSTAGGDGVAVGVSTGDADGVAVGVSGGDAVGVGGVALAVAVAVTVAFTGVTGGPSLSPPTRKAMTAATTETMRSGRATMTKKPDRERALMPHPLGRR